jgi:hypothetical protein
MSSLIGIHAHNHSPKGQKWFQYQNGGMFGFGNIFVEEFEYLSMMIGGIYQVQFGKSQA